MPVPKVIDEDTKMRLLELREEGNSVARIGRMTGLTDRRVRELLADARLEKTLGVQLPDASAKPVRCGKCGALVQPPCLGCQIDRVSKEEMP